MPRPVLDTAILLDTDAYNLALLDALVDFRDWYWAEFRTFPIQQDTPLTALRRQALTKTTMLVGDPAWAARETKPGEALPEPPQFARLRTEIEARTRATLTKVETTGDEE